jgi:8-oxo-dGTP pyrophosphatase MutT (NUDIX family)
VKARRSGIWSFPKGHAKQEEPAFVAARREIWEETGYALEHLPHLPPRFTRLRGGIYYLIDLPELPTPEPLPQDTEEIEETRWVTRDEMTYLIGNSGMKDFLERQ